MIENSSTSSKGGGEIQESFSAHRGRGGEKIRRLVKGKWGCFVLLGGFGFVGWGVGFGWGGFLCLGGCFFLFGGFCWGGVLLVFLWDGVGGVFLWVLWGGVSGYWVGCLGVFGGEVVSVVCMLEFWCFGR